MVFWKKCPEEKQNEWRIPTFMSSAVTTANDQVKRAWNSETVASTLGSTKATIETAVNATSNLATSAATATNDQLRKTWNSETMASTLDSTKSLVKNIRNFFETRPSDNCEIESEKSTFENRNNDKVRGAAFALHSNAAKYAVTSMSTKSSNVLNIFDKTKISSIGNPELFARVEIPHKTVKFHHLNQFKKSPVQLSSTGATATGYAGKIAEKANDLAPVVTGVVLAVEGYRIGQEVMKDYEHGTSRNTVQTVSTTAGTYTSSWFGWTSGATIGSYVCPGLGTLFGGLIGSVVGGNYGGHFSRVATEKTLDIMEWDVKKLKCGECEKEIVWKKFTNIERPVCCVPKSKI